MEGIVSEDIERDGVAKELTDALFLAEYYFSDGLPKSLDNCYWYACENRYIECLKKM